MTFAETIEQGARKCGKIFFWIAGIVAVLTFLGTLELAFIFSIASIAQWIKYYGGDLSGLIAIVKVHSFALQFTLVILAFGVGAWTLYATLKHLRQAREKNLAQWQKSRQDFKQEVIEEIKKEVSDDLKIDCVDLTGLAKPRKARRKR